MTHNYPHGIELDTVQLPLDPDAKTIAIAGERPNPTASGGMPEISEAPRIYPA
jgi:hypothetical protein